MSTEQTSYRPEYFGAAPPASETVVTPNDEGELRWFHGQLAIIKATTEQTNGQMTALEMISPPGVSSPLHIHHAEDEGFLILEGEVTFQVGDAFVTAGPGDFLIGPRDVPHAYVVGPQGARMFWTLWPGGFDEFVRDASVAAPSRTTPPPAEPTEEYLAELERICARHKITILGPATALLQEAEAA